MKYKVGDTVLLEATIFNIDIEPQVANYCYFLTEDYARKAQIANEFWLDMHAIEKKQPVWRDGAVEQPTLALGTCAYIMYKTHEGDISTVWAGQKPPVAWHDVYWLYADEFPMPRLPEQAIENCLYCGGDCGVKYNEFDDWFIQCIYCGYQSSKFTDGGKAIDKHNQVVRKLRYNE